MEITTFDKIKEAYMASTPANNLFEKTLNSIHWDTTYQADDEFYFVKGEMTFVTKSLNPFEIPAWDKPCALFDDGSRIYF